VLGFIFVSAGHGGFAGSLGYPGAVEAPGFIGAEIKNIVSDNQPPDIAVLQRGVKSAQCPIVPHVTDKGYISVKSLSSILQFFNSSILQF